MTEGQGRNQTLAPEALRVWAVQLYMESGSRRHGSTAEPKFRSAANSTEMALSPSPLPSSRALGSAGAFYRSGVLGHQRLTAYLLPELMCGDPRKVGGQRGG